MIVRLLKDIQTTGGLQTAGTEYFHPDAVWLCRMDLALPVNQAGQDEWEAFCVAHHLPAPPPLSV